MKIKIFKKEPKLQPLKLANIMVALVNQQQKQDHTQKHKQYLKQLKKSNGLNIHQLIDQQNIHQETVINLQPIIMLPDFIEHSKNQKQVILHILHIINQTNDRLKQTKKNKDMLSNQNKYSNQIQSSQSKQPHMRKKSVNFKSNNQGKLQYTVQLFPAIQNICKNYQHLLQQITDKLSRSLSNHETNLLLGKKSIEDLRIKLIQTTQSISNKRKLMISIHRIYQEHNQKIIKKLRKKNALEKISIAMKLWKNSQLQVILKNNKKESSNKNLQSLSSIQILRKIAHIKKKLNVQFENLKKYACFKNIFQKIQTKQKQIINKIEDGMFKNIINFQSKDSYIRDYNQYMNYLQFLNNPQSEGLQIKENYKLSQQKSSIMQDIDKLVSQNLKYLYSFTLSQTMNSHLNNLELLNQRSYFIFFKVLLSITLPKYFQNWHQVTSIHLQLQSGYGQKMVHYRQKLFSKMAQMVTNAIKFSNKFGHIDDVYRLKILTCVYNFIQLGQEWGGCRLKIQLGPLLLQKMKKQLQIFFKTGNGQLKGILVNQLSASSVLQPYKDRTLGQIVDDKQNAEAIRNNKEIDLKAIRQLLKDNVEYNKNHIRYNRQKIKENNQLKQQQTFQQQEKETTLQNQCKNLPKKQRKKSMSEQLSLVSPTLQYLCKMMKTYTYRSLYMPISICQYFYQHVQLIVFMLYKLCISDQTKIYIYNDVISDDNLKKLKILTKSNLKDISSKELQKQFPLMIQQLLQSYNRKRVHFNIYQFLKDIGSKYDGMNASGHINVNKIFEPTYQDYLVPYYARILRILQDLLKLVYLVKMIVQQEQDKNNISHKKVNKLPDAIKQLVLLIFHQYHQSLLKKYISTAGSLITTLKWDIKKFNQQTAVNYKQYKMKFLQIFRSSQQNFYHFLDHKDLKDLFRQKQTQLFFRSLLESYGKIQKINDNGRQLLRVDSIQIIKILQQFNQHQKIWTHWFQRFLQYTHERASKTLLEKIKAVTLFYPINYWRFNMFWVISDFSSRQKKEYLQNLLSVYITQLKEIAQTGML